MKIRGDLPLKKLSENQEKIMAYILERAQLGLPPSVREICKATGLKSTSTVHSHLKSLEKNGYITRESGLNRAIHITGNKFIQVPIIDKFDKSKDNILKNNIQGYVSYNPSPKDNEELFAFIVKNNKMKNIHIVKNDIIITCITKKIEELDWAVLLHNDNLIVTKLIKSSNNEFVIDKNNDIKDFTIIGKMLCLIRKY